jgi:hypothetical protein
MKRHFPKNLSPEDRLTAVFRELDQVMRGDARGNNLIEEQLRQCPEAFEAGKTIEKLCDSLKYDGRGGTRIFPPAGVTIPPIV